MTTAYEVTLNALAEAGEEPTRAAVAATGCNRVGHPLPGLLGWLPDRERHVMAKAVVLGHQAAGSKNFNLDANELAAHVHSLADRVVMVPSADTARVIAAVTAFTKAGGQL